MSEEIAPVEVADTVSTEQVQEAPAEKQWYDSAGDDWRSTLPDELGNHSFLQKYDNPIEAIKGAVNLSSLMGKKVESVPDENSTPEQIAEFYGKLGVPESADDYKIEFESVPEGLSIDEGSIESFKGLAKELNLTPSQAQKIAEFQVGMEAAKGEADIEAREISINESREALQSEWKHGAYEKNIAKVTQALDFLGIRDVVDQTGMGANSDFIKAVYDKIVPAIDSDKLIEASSPDNFATVSSSLDAIETKIHSYAGQTTAPEYKALLSQRMDLLKRIN